MCREIKKGKKREKEMKEGKKMDYNRGILLFQPSHQAITDTTFQSEVWVTDLPMRSSKTSNMTLSSSPIIEV